MRETVFHIVDGHMVPKPGNARDPKRRYRGIGPDPETGEQRVCEFTSTEEAERDVEEAKWKAEQPIREAARREQVERARAHRATLKYEERFIAFLDILGWRAAIQRSLSDAELVPVLGLSLDLFSGFANHIAWVHDGGREGSWPGDPQMTHFSDSVVVSARADRAGYSHLKSALWFLSTALLQGGFLVRGGIASGPLYHKSANVYGPAMIAAYDLERTRAKYPRIVLQEDLAASWVASERIYDGKTGAFLGSFKVWRKDRDGMWFFDYLQPITASTHEPSSPDMVKNTLEPARSIIEKAIRNPSSDVRVLEKYLWAAAYFNAVADEYPNATVARIPVSHH